MSLPPGFIAVHGNHPEQLRQAVVEFSRRQPLAPLESEVIIVQSNGAAQWLRLEMAKSTHRGGLGVAAGVDFQLPLAFVWQIYRAFLGHDQVPAQSPYDKGPLTWRLYRQLPQWIKTNEAYDPLSRFLQGGQDDRRRYQLAEKLADLYDQYQVYRADWLSQWETGALDYFGKPLDSEQRWQAEL
ncbi:MAG: exodeoxyribonuclease V subunit gamma, partial [Pseudomonadales bacterium]